jgi:hypothetical protein
MRFLPVMFMICLEAIPVICGVLDVANKAKQQQPAVQPHVLQDDEEDKFWHGRVKRVEFTLNKPKTCLDELSNRLVVANTYWAIGQATDDQHYRNYAVGNLDATVPPPSGSRVEYKHGGFSSYGHLLELLNKVKAEPTGFSSDDGKPIFTEKEEKRLLYMAKPRFNGGAYLALPLDEVSELLALLDKIEKNQYDIRWKAILRKAKQDEKDEKPEPDAPKADPVE